jgi:hypothetical protein
MQLQQELLQHQMVHHDETESKMHSPLGMPLFHDPTGYKGYTF